MVALAYLKLVRAPILVLIFCIQYATRYWLIKPMLVVNGFQFVVDDLTFFLYSLGGVLIAAGGFAINDYFDVKIDRVNKPKEVVVDRLIKRRVAMATHVVLSAAGVALSGWACYQAGSWKLVSLFLLAFVALWFYSTNLKHQPLIGNLVIAIMAGMVPLLVGLLDIPLLNKAYAEVAMTNSGSVFNAPAFWVIGYSVLFFFLTLLREIGKDIRDYRGDKQFGSRTIPVVIGIKWTKTVLIFGYLIIAASLLWSHNRYFSGVGMITATTYLLAALAIINAILTFKARTKSLFRWSIEVNNAMTLVAIASMYAVKYAIEQVFA
ncbi:MAG: hypothetical protein Kow0075_07350 [Salibacteraceae bacterium]